MYWTIFRKFKNKNRLPVRAKGTTDVATTAPTVVAISEEACAWSAVGV